MRTQADSLTPPPALQRRPRPPLSSDATWTRARTRSRSGKLLPCIITGEGRAALLTGLIAFRMPCVRASPLHEVVQQGVKALEETRTAKRRPRCHEWHAHEQAQTPQWGSGSEAPSDTKAATHDIRGTPRHIL